MHSIWQEGAEITVEYRRVKSIAKKLLRCGQNLWFSERSLASLPSPLSFYMILYSSIWPGFWVSLFLESPLVLRGLLQSDILGDHSETAYNERKRLRDLVCSIQPCNIMQRSKLFNLLSSLRIVFAIFDTKLPIYRRCLCVETSWTARSAQSKSMHEPAIGLT